ncbi:MAG TPA: DNA polymerase clamp loader subunit A, partial [bacterium]
ISYTKEDLLVDEKMEKLYERDNAFVCNRVLAFHVDCVLRVNEINRRPWLPGKLRFDYLLNIIPRRSRKLNWVKGEKDEFIKVIQETYQYNYNKAVAVLDVLTIPQLELLRKELETGGKQ